MVPILMGMLLIITSTVVLFEDAEAQRNTNRVAAGTLSGTVTCPNGDSSSATLLFGVEQYHDYRGLTGTAGNYRILASQPVGEIQECLPMGMLAINRSG